MNKAANQHRGFDKEGERYDYSKQVYQTAHSSRDGGNELPTACGIRCGSSLTHFRIYTSPIHDTMLAERRRSEKRRLRHKETDAD
ncbi:MAG TPA: hypothetical protein VFF31_09365 [Blastocatellia bacterium]|nr:hypothetical protein [Blastocatellia bacterium]